MSRGLVVGLGEDWVLVPIEHVAEVMPAPRATRIPRPGPHLSGVFALRGTVLPLWHAAGLLGLGGESAPPLCVRLTVDGTQLALLVDRVEGLRHILGARSESASWWAAGAVHLSIGPDAPDRTVTVLDPQALLRRMLS